MPTGDKQSHRTVAKLLAPLSAAVETKQVTIDGRQLNAEAIIEATRVRERPRRGQRGGGGGTKFEDCAVEGYSVRLSDCFLYAFGPPSGSS